jgi:hypothetical protein
MAAAEKMTGKDPGYLAALRALSKFRESGCGAGVLGRASLDANLRAGATAQSGRVGEVGVTMWIDWRRVSGRRNQTLVRPYLLLISTIPSPETLPC